MEGTGVIFVSERLRCRCWKPDELAPLMEVYGDAEAMRWVGDGKPMSIEEGKRWLQVTADNYQLRGYGMFALDDLDSGETIGYCGLVHPGGQEEAEVKYAFQKSCWGRGLATEAVTALLAWGATNRQLHRVIATVDEENLASQRVLEKAGMKNTGIRYPDDGSFTLVFDWIYRTGQPADEC